MMYFGFFCFICIHPRTLVLYFFFACIVVICDNVTTHPFYDYIHDLYIFFCISLHNQFQDAYIDIIQCSFYLNLSSIVAYIIPLQSRTASGA